VISIEKTNDRAVGAKTSAADLFFLDGGDGKK
jgi:hypothetical protein